MLAAQNDNVKAAEKIAVQYEVVAMIGSGSEEDYVSFWLAEDPFESAARLLQMTNLHVDFLPHVALIDDVLQLRCVWVVDGVSDPDQVILRRGDLVQNSDGTFGVLTRCVSEPREYRVIEGLGMTVRIHRNRPRRARSRMKNARRALASRVQHYLRFAA